MILKAACALSCTRGTLTLVSALFRTEPDYPERMHATIHNHLLRSETRYLIDARLERIWEANLMPASTRSADVSSLFGALDVENNFRSIQECISNVVVSHDPDLHPVTARHFWSLGVTLAAAYFFAFLILAVESVRRRRSKRRVHSYSAALTERKRGNHRRGTHATAPGSDPPFEMLRISSA